MSWGAIWVSKKFFTVRMLIFPEFMHFSHLEKSTGHVFFQCCVVHPLYELTEGCVWKKFFLSEKTVPSMLIWYCHWNRTRTMWSCFCSESCESWHRWWDRKCVMEGIPPPFSTDHFLYFFNHQLKVKARWKGCNSLCENLKNGVWEFHA